VVKEGIHYLAALVLTLCMVATEEIVFGAELVLIRCIEVLAITRLAMREMGQLMRFF